MFFASSIQSAAAPWVLLELLLLSPSNILWRINFSQPPPPVFLFLLHFLVFLAFYRGRTYTLVHAPSRSLTNTFKRAQVRKGSKWYVIVVPCSFSSRTVLWWHERRQSRNEPPEPLPSFIHFLKRIIIIIRCHHPGINRIEFPSGCPGNIFIEEVIMRTSKQEKKKKMREI